MINKRKNTTNKQV